MVTNHSIQVAVLVRNKRNILEQVIAVIDNFKFQPLSIIIHCQALDALLLSAYFTKPASEAELSQDTKTLNLSTGQ